MNVEGMLPFENMIADYVHETDNHVLYRVTPIYDGTNLVASGVQLEAESVEDDGEGVLFNVYVYNVQPGITIDYATGESWQEQGTTTTPVQEEPVPGRAGGADAGFERDYLHTEYEHQEIPLSELFQCRPDEREE